MAGNCLAPVKLTGSGRPVLEPNEIECFFLSGVDLLSEDDPSFPHLKSGLLILTTHRLLWLPDSAASAGGTAGAIPLAAVSHIFSPKMSLRKVFASPRVRFQVSLSPEGRVSAAGSRSVVATAVVRGKGDCDAFLAKFMENCRARAWQEAESGSSSGSNSAVMAATATASSSGGIYSSDGTVRMVGVSGILRKEQEMWESTDRSLQEAFQDLNALMSKAKEMVMLAEKMRLKLLSGSNSQTNATNDEEMGSKEEMQDWLLSVGIISPVTKESAGALYHQQLSRQLADFVKVPLEKAGGIINLIDIYCLFNRARGTELISPDDLLQACSLWEKFDVQVVLRKFDSGVMVIQTKSHSDEEAQLPELEHEQRKSKHEDHLWTESLKGISRRGYTRVENQVLDTKLGLKISQAAMLSQTHQILKVFNKVKMLVLKPDALRAGISASDAARTLGVAPAMAKEHLLSAESKGLLCRDISPDGFRFYINLFVEIDRDYMYLVKDQGIYASWVQANDTHA
ncbi:Vacuolar protein sorting-associated protein 36 isoform C [Glycine soja]|uniref:Vacuolar protein-sorting-associated protein 36 n=1 Tax=Glycine soja TaxID=3848 RepID=A0A445JIR4_GLYSO|nr:Vacuolar protein sorting-associated protein 36 isoform C [Glycine soja]